MTALVPTKTPITWEVGSGHGHFLTAYAAAHPTELCIGVDITKDRVDRGVRKRDRAALRNLHFLHADARDFLRTLPAGAVIARTFILFPDPWPKRRHFKNRIMQPEFLHALAERAGEGAGLHFRTDHEEYFAAARQVVQEHPDWEIRDEPWPFEHVTVFQERADRHFSLSARRRTAARH